MQDDEKAAQQSRHSLFGWLKKDEKVLDVDYVYRMIVKEVPLQPCINPSPFYSPQHCRCMPFACVVNLILCVRCVY